MPRYSRYLFMMVMIN